MTHMSPLDMTQVSPYTLHKKHYIFFYKKNQNGDKDCSLRSQSLLQQDIY